MALAFLLGVFFLVIIMVAIFVFPPSRWAMGAKDDPRANDAAPPRDVRASRETK